MDDSGFPRTPDRPVKLLGTCVSYLRSVKTSIGARGPDFLGGFAIVLSHGPGNHASPMVRQIEYRINQKLGGLAKSFL